MLQGSRNRTHPASQQEPPGRPERRASGPRCLRGKEDLGDGLHAVFQLESGFDSRNGRSLQGGRLFGRQATVGLLNARWGELRLGRQYNAATRYFLDMLGPAFGGFSLLHGYGLGMTSASFPRYDNQIFYQTPSMGGIKAAAGYAFSVNDTRNAETGYATANNTRAITAALQYAGARSAPSSATTSSTLPAAQRRPGRRHAPRLHHRRLIRFHALKIAVAYNRVADGWFAGRSFRDGGRVDWQAPRRMRFPGTALHPCHRARRSDGPQPGHAFASWQRTTSTPTTDRRRRHRPNIQPGLHSHNLSKRTDLYALVFHTRNWAFVDGVQPWTHTRACVIDSDRRYQPCCRRNTALPDATAQSRGCLREPQKR